VTIEFDHQALSDILGGTGVKIIGNSGQAYFRDFYYALESDLMKVFREPEDQIKLVA
jgi:GTP:adenosylcobinamide-phosphate guanylyltransferase